MATNGNVPYGHGGPVPAPGRPAFPTPRRMPDDQLAGRGRMPWWIVGTVSVLACIAALWFGGPWAGGPSSRPLEPKQIGDLNEGLRKTLRHPKFAAQSKKHPELAGADFYAFAIRAKLMDDGMLSKVLSLRTVTEEKAEREPFLEGVAPEKPWCSYTAPRMGELAALVDRSGNERVVLVTFNSRNWNNYEEMGTIVLWSDSDEGCFFTFAEAHEQYGITAEEWADPAGKLFGRKAPFQHTYE